MNAVVIASVIIGSMPRKKDKPAVRASTGSSVRAGWGCESGAASLGLAAAVSPELEALIGRPPTTRACFGTVNICAAGPASINTPR